MVAPKDELTEEQRRAVEATGTSIVLSAVAGCGKTRVLVQRYFRYLESGVAPREIVAITFTEKAALEMRRKILKEIREKLRSEVDESRIDWRRISREMESAPIGTIHSFCSSILRLNAIKAGIDPEFAVLDEAIGSGQREESLQQHLFDLLTAQGPVGDDLRALIIIYGWRATFQALEGLISQYRPETWEPWTQSSPETIANDWVHYRDQTLIPQYIREKVLSSPDVKDCLAIVRDATVVTDESLRANFDKLANRVPKLSECSNLSDEIAELTQAATVGRRGAKVWRDKETYERAKSVFERFRKTLRDSLKIANPRPENLDESAEIGLRFARVAASAAKHYRLFKDNRGVLDFDDLIQRTDLFLRKNPTIAKMLGSRFRYLMVDELQDTDEEQLSIIEQLAGKPGESSKLFAVGDANQSIYRFRGAVMELFHQLRQSIDSGGRLNLSTNFRSDPAILRFVNEVMKDRIRDFQVLQPRVPNDSNSSDGEMEFLWAPLKTELSAPAKREAEAANIASYIRELVRSKKAEPGEIVLLFRSMNQTPIYESALREAGLDYHILGGRAFFAQQEVYDLLHLLRTVENPQDNQSLAGMLRSPFAALSDEALFVLANHSDGLWAGLHDKNTVSQLPKEQVARVNRIVQWLGHWRAQKDRLSIVELINLVVADSGYDAALQFEPLGERKLANLWKLMDQAREFDRSDFVGIADFIHWLDNMVRTNLKEEQAATKPEDADVIRLMSIHQSKGMEFPVVVLPDLNRTERGSHSLVAVWHPQLGCVARPPQEDGKPLFPDFAWNVYRAAETLAESAEELRIFYVACTRAEKRLILSAAIEDDAKPANPIFQLLTDQVNIQTGKLHNGDERPVATVISRPDSDALNSIGRQGY